MQRNPAGQRHGTVYLIVLVGVTIVTIVGLWSVFQTRVRGHRERLIEDAAAARRHARSAIEVGLRAISQSPTWRTDLGDGAWLTGFAVGDGSCSLDATDPADGVIATGPMDPVVLTAVGMQGVARHKTRATLTARGIGMDSLSAALYTAGAADLQNATVFADGVIGAAGDMTATSCRIEADVESAGWISGGRFLGSQSAWATARSVPGASVLDAYVQRGVVMAAATIPGRTIERTLISPASNPYGSPSAAGIYVIDCGGADITIRDCRIVATLVLLDPGASSRVTSSVAWEAPASGEPALLVRGAMTIETGSDDLEESAIGVNLNPADTPYRGVSDTDTTDVYASRIDGLIFTSGDLATRNEVRIGGVVVVGGAFTCKDRLTVTHDPMYSSDPPWGFADSVSMHIAHGTLAQTVD